MKVDFTDPETIAEIRKYLHEHLTGDISWESSGIWCDVYLDNHLVKIIDDGE